MLKSRREFLRVGTVAGLFAAISLKSVVSVLGQQAGSERTALFTIPVESQGDPLDSLTEEVLSGHLNTMFQVHTSSGRAITLKLIKVTGWQPASAATAANSPALECFSALFRGPRSRALESGRYLITHDQLGIFELFITPVNDHSKDRFYEAVFNRLRS
jgi:uncharacterized protein DUF6916